MSGLAAATVEITRALKKEIMGSRPEGQCKPEYFRAHGYETAVHNSPSGKRADAIRALFTEPDPFIYKNDLIVGSIRPLFAEPDAEKDRVAAAYLAEFPERGFVRNGDHFAADYYTAVELGIPGLLERIAASERKFSGTPEHAGRLEFLNSMRITLEALRERLLMHARKAEALAGAEGYDGDKLAFIRANCLALADRAPSTFTEGLQLVWMIHTAFVYEGRYAMALGRIDQYLYPLYKKEIDAGTLTPEAATALLANAFAKICERRYCGGDDVVNICIGGITRDGAQAVNELSYCTLYAVRDVNLPGPNLSARIGEDTPDRFLDECLKVIGTGLGYPALMNDRVNMAALSRFGYDPADVRDYCMVGCIENFMAGKQPPWVDGRFDPIGPLLEIISGFAASDDEGAGAEQLPATMDAFMARYKARLAQSVKDYIRCVNAASHVPDPENHTSPFLSCFCECCIDRGLDINDGGARYLSAHGAGLIGIGTVSDSLAAIEKVVYVDRAATLGELARALAADFNGYDELYARLSAAPKYGNNDDFVDKYAMFYTAYISDLFDCERSHDGGAIYTAMASNISNIYCGQGLGATPDGRHAGQPLSDAASPTYGRDTRGVTSTFLSISKPDYTRCACGTVVNQKFSPDVFKDGKREKLASLIRVYFRRGGQEVQINSTSRRVLKDAMAHPENYQSLVVRVSGFSALYVTLGREVQEDILARTQHEDV